MVDVKKLTDKQLWQLKKDIESGQYLMDLESVGYGNQSEMVKISGLGQAKLIRQIDMEVKDRAQKGLRLGKVWGHPIMVAGITFRVKHMSQISTDDILVEAEPDNPHDPNAIKVWNVTKNGNFHIGYIPRDIACKIDAKLLPSKGRITWRSNDPIKVGVRIAI